MTTLIDTQSSFDEVCSVINRLEAENQRLNKAQAVLLKQTKTLARELLFMINKANRELASNISCTDMTPPDYFDAQTVHEAYLAIDRVEGNTL